MRTACYLRISSDPEGTHLGTDRQEVDCLALCADRGWTVVKTYRDEDTSARAKVRPQYSAMMRDVAAGEIDAIVAYAPDRLYRQLGDLVAFIATVQAAHVEVATVADGAVTLNTASGRRDAANAGVAAAYESERLAERVTRKMLDLAAGGHAHGGPRPYGYQKGGMIVNEREAGLIRQAARAILDDGVSIRRVCLTIFKDELTPLGNHWDPTALTRMLVSHRLVAKRRHGADLYPAKWPAILTAEDSLRLQSMAASRAQGRRTGRPPEHLLSGLLRCRVCDSLMQRTSGTRSAYQCPPAPRGCNSVSVGASGAEWFITGVVLDMADRAVLDYADQPSASAASNTDADRAALAQLTADFGAGDISPEDYLASSSVVRARLKRQRVVAQEAALQAAKLAGTPRPDRLRALWPTLETRKRRAVIQAVLSPITVDTVASVTYGDVIAHQDRFSFNALGPRRVAV